MSSAAALATFLGWCTVINVGIMVFVLLLANTFHAGIGRVHARIFGITEDEARATFFRVFQQYRLAVGMLNLVPYIALKIVA